MFGENGEIELIGNADGTGNLEGGTVHREVAIRAVDRAAAKLDGSGLQHTMTWRNTVLVGCDHGLTLAQKPFQSLTTVRKGSNFCPFALR